MVLHVTGSWILINKYYLYFYSYYYYHHHHHEDDDDGDDDDEDYELQPCISSSTSLFKDYKTVSGNERL